MPNILSKKIVFAVILVAVLVGTVGSASAGFMDFVKEGRSLIWPAPRIFDINVTSPNGGERWVKGETYAITWDINDARIQEWLDKFESKGNGRPDGFYPYPMRKLDLLVFLVNDRPILAKPQIASDQIREFFPDPTSVFLGRANIYDRRMNWNIPNNIPARNGYKVRLVAVWGPAYDAVNSQGMINRLPHVISDESDRPFSIVNRERPTPTPEPIDVEELLRQIEQMRRELNVMKQSFNRMDSILVRMEHIIRALIGR